MLEILWPIFEASKSFRLWCLYVCMYVLTSFTCFAQPVDCENKDKGGENVWTLVIRLTFWQRSIWRLLVLTLVENFISLLWLSGALYRQNKRFENSFSDWKALHHQPGSLAFAKWLKLFRQNSANWLNCHKKLSLFCFDTSWLLLIEVSWRVKGEPCVRNLRKKFLITNQNQEKHPWRKHTQNENLRLIFAAL